MPWGDDDEMYAEIYYNRGCWDAAAVPLPGAQDLVFNPPRRRAIRAEPLMTPTACNRWSPGFVAVVGATPRMAPSAMRRSSICMGNTRAALRREPGSRIHSRYRLFSGAGRTPPEVPNTILRWAIAISSRPWTRRLRWAWRRPFTRAAAGGATACASASPKGGRGPAAVRW